MNLDFNTIKKQAITITFRDGKVLHLLPPTKEMVDEFVNLDFIQSDEDALRELYEVGAKLISHNSEGKRITARKLRRKLDFEDMLHFKGCYVDYLSSLVSLKN